jgi:hypothetical protein
MCAIPGNLAVQEHMEMSDAGQVILLLLMY